MPDFKQGDTAYIAATGTPVEIVTTSAQGYALVRSRFGQWSYRLDELRHEGQPLDVACPV